MPSKTALEGIVFVFLLFTSRTMTPGRQFAPLFLSEKKRFSCNQRGTAANPFNNRPDFSSVPLPASRKIRLTVRPAFPLRQKRLSRHQRGTAANPLQYQSRLLLRVSPRKPQNPVDSSSRFSSPAKTAFPPSTRHGGKPVQYQSRLLRPLTINGLPCFV